MPSTPDTPKVSQMFSRTGTALSPEVRASIPMLYVQLGSKNKVAQTLGIGYATVDRWLAKLTGEEWERIQEEQRKELLRRSIDVLYGCFDLMPERIKDANLNALVGAVKVIGERAAAWGGPGAVQKGGVATDELDQFLAEAEMRRRQKAIEEALESGSMEGLKAFVKS